MRTVTGHMCVYYSWELSDINLSVTGCVLQDKYLHTNCLAALANMSAQFTNLHQYVAQKLVR